MTLRPWASGSSCFEGGCCLHIRESMAHQHCPDDFIYCKLHDVAGVWRLLNDAVNSSDSTASINENEKTYASGHWLICGTILTFFRGTWKTTKKVFHVKQLWAKNYNCDSQIRRSAPVLQLLTWGQNAFIQTFTHTYVGLPKNSGNLTIKNVSHRNS